MFWHQDVGEPIVVRSTIEQGTGVSGCVPTHNPQYTTTALCITL